MKLRKCHCKQSHKSFSLNRDLPLYIKSHMSNNFYNVMHTIITRQFNLGEHKEILRGKHRSAVCKTTKDFSQNRAANERRRCLNHRKHAESLKSGALFCTHLTRRVFFTIIRNVNRTQFCGVLRCLKHRRVVCLTCFSDVLTAVFIVQKVGLVVFKL